MMDHKTNKLIPVLIVIMLLNICATAALGLALHRQSAAVSAAPAVQTAPTAPAEDAAAFAKASAGVSAPAGDTADTAGDSSAAETVSAPAGENSSTIRFVMYIGTNDKDTYAQIIPTEQAEEIIDDICFQYVEGYTIQDATGSWVDEKGIATHENTIVCYFYGTDEETVHRIGDDIIKALNQNSVLIEKDHIEIEYYGGAQ